MSRLATDILIVGGGPAGLAAAAAASETAGKCITVVDDNPNLGGQIWKASLGRFRSAEARNLIDALSTGKVHIVNHAQVFGSLNTCTLLAETPEGSLELEFEKLIIATGAREMFLPFSGWTLPNVCGAGGLQALVKGGLKIENRRVVVAGTGALLLVVAEFLKTKGANVVAIAEQAPVAKINRFALGLWRSPTKILQAIDLKRKLFDIPYLTDCWVKSAGGESNLTTVELTRRGKNWTVECDYLACGFHLVPNTELAAVLGCRIEEGFVSVNEYQETSIENIFCAGEPTGIGGVEASLIEGKIAGLTACGETEKASRLFTRRGKARRFGDTLNKTFALREELKLLPNADTIVCRCEDIDYGRLTEFSNFRDAKLQTRCGMGPCQGRICGTATNFLFGWKPGSVRPPIFPVKMENL
ncbi:MAG: FAD-dependent oxidoreductase [Pyrinomonadaceae bacterium]|nr:FAD-dependent oxidoreductase [Acidobacteriota bacterium]MBP7376431.1 FAD-dependent oxidoreductase [Pyrinomonadaceae bacterium]